MRSRVPRSFSRVFTSVVLAGLLFVPVFFIVRAQRDSLIKRDPLKTLGGPGTEADRSIAPVTIDDKVQDPDTIFLNSGSINVNSADARAMKVPVKNFSGKQLRLVKFGGPIQPEWFAALRQSGVELVDYIPSYAYLVYGDYASMSRIQVNSKQANSPVKWDAEYTDLNRINPDVYANPKFTTGPEARAGAEYFEIQMFKDPSANAATIAQMNSLQTKPMKEHWEYNHYVNTTVALTLDGVREIAKRPDVISIMRYVDPVKFDERQDLIVSGNISGNLPTATNYLDWLAGKGFTQAQFTASNFAVNITDSGIDNGTQTPNHFGLYKLGDPTNPANSRIIYNRLEGTPNSGSTIQGCDGHGTENTHIIGGYVPNGAPFNAAPHSDASSYRFGLGVCPFVKIGSSVIFDPDTYTNPNIPLLEQMAYANGARISSNSWGSSATAYDAVAQSYDGIARDADTGTTGNQEYVIIFAAGNNGPDATSVGRPGNAKNLITAAASENVQAFGGADGCATGDSDADSANDIADFSSRGPTPDGRNKPDLSAPGTHVSGGVFQSTLVTPTGSGTGAAGACFTGDGVCGGVGQSFFPAGQQWYTASSGTSHSTPAIAGATALIRQFFINQSLAPPSPAMTKGLLMSSAHNMNGTFANDNLWSNNQGMGLMDINAAFNTVSNAAHILRDEVPADLFTASGQQRVFTGTIANTGAPVRITVAYTDVPGPTSGAVNVNNLDLEVVVNGTLYRGNNFTNGNSTAGGTADGKNNVESVFLPAGTSGSIAIKVKATNIAGDGVPGNASALDQDFALVASNITESPLAIVESQGNTITAESCAVDNRLDPGENITVSFAIQNSGTANSGAITATLQATGGVTNPSAPQNYGTLNVGAGPTSRSFSFKVDPNQVCGNPVTLTFSISDSGNPIASTTFTYQSGMATAGQSQNFDGVTAPALPVGWTSTVVTGGSQNWATVSTASASAPNSVFTNDPGAVSEADLETPPITITSATAQVAFKIFYNTEASTTAGVGYDGTVLEIKIPSVNGGAYQDIVAAGGSFVTNGYNRTISATFSNPLANRMAWSGNSAAFLPVLITLPASANGQAIQLKWRMGSDDSVSATGVWIDDLAVSPFSFACCSTTQSVTSRADFDGDGKSDVSVVRGGGTWYLNRSTAGFTGVSFGTAGDVAVPGDFDGDGKADEAVFRGGTTWYLLRSTAGFTGVAFGASGDIPVAGDYDGDGKTDIAVFRPSTSVWYILRSSDGGVTSVNWGQSADVPVAGDFDGDGKADQTVFRPTTGSWFTQKSSGGSSSANWGLTGDNLVPADYDGDHKDDYAVFRSGNWYILNSSGGTQTVNFGLAGDVPAPGDYDGDGKADIAVFRSGSWYLLQSTAGFSSQAFGIAGDVAVPSRYIP
jgi:hypothetical protein